MTSRFISVVIVLLTACGEKANPSVCCVSQADCSSLGIDEPVRNCSEGSSCVDHMCTPPQCEVDQDCGGATPYCADGVCVLCRNDADCTDPNASLCDLAAHTCHGCTSDAECSSQACDFETGACIAASAVLYAAPGASDQGSCTQAQPCSVTRAVTVATNTRFTVKLAPGVYVASLVVDRKLSIHGDAATLVATSNARALLVIDAADARIYGLAIANNTDGELGIMCQSNDNINTPQVALDRVVVDTQGEPFHANQCRATASRSTFKSPRNTNLTFSIGLGGTASFDRSRFLGGGSIAAIEGHVTITNSVLDGLLGDANYGALVTATAGGSISISYSTVFNSSITCGPGSPACASAVRAGLCIENSIVAKPTPGDTVTGTNCRFSYSMISPQQATIPGDNNILGGDPAFRDPANGDLHLRPDNPASPAINAANPSASPTADYDGVARPQGGRGDLGAFEFKP